jgi:hypothetical protein
MPATNSILSKDLKESPSRSLSTTSATGYYAKNAFQALTNCFLYDLVNLLRPGFRSVEEREKMGFAVVSRVVVRGLWGEI